MSWDFDGLGYIFMGLATLIAVPAFEKHGFQKWVRIAFIANALLTPLITFVLLSRVFREATYDWSAIGGYCAIGNVNACNYVQKKIAE